MAFQEKLKITEHIGFVMNGKPVVNGKVIDPSKNKAQEPPPPATEPPPQEESETDK